MNKPEAIRKTFKDIDFNMNPFIVIWEVTRACDLACRHCRASAKKNADPNELSIEAGQKLLEEIARFGQPLFIITGGDPAKRKDIFDIIAKAKDLGLRVAMTPSGTPLVTKEFLRNCKNSGLQRLAISLDGSTKEIHDDFRRVNGSYQLTMDIIQNANELELGVQINTTITKYNVKDLDKMVELMKKVNIVMWSVFFLVPTGRGEIYDIASAVEFESIFNKLYDLSKIAPFDIKTTAAPQYRRVVMQRKKLEQNNLTENFYTPGFGMHYEKDKIGRALAGVNEGKGFVFISHTGEIYPSGFLPLNCGNVQDVGLVETYRNNIHFKTIRNYDLLKGKCGICDFKNICGGSRARAYAITGDYLESDPYCVYKKNEIN